MKNKLFYLVVLATFCCFKSSAQESFIIKKDGSKSTIDGATVKISDDFTKVEYQNEGNDKKTKIKLNEIKSGILGDYRIETYTFDKKEVECFVIAESDAKKLVGYNKVTSSTIPVGPQAGNQTGYIYFNYFIIDANGNVLEKMKFEGGYEIISAVDRDKAEVILRKHFSDCPFFIARLKQYDTKEWDMKGASKMEKKMTERLDDVNAKMIKLFENPIYTNCNDVLIPERTNVYKENLDDLLKEVNGTYNFGAMTAGLNGKRMYMKVKGIITIKDGFVNISVKEREAKYQITDYKNGIITCLDRGLQYTIEIASEEGKESSFNYTKRITVAYDKKIGGDPVDYWCVKE